MRKTAVFIILLLIFIPIASADPFTDWFRGLFGITGKVTSEKPIILHRTVRDCATGNAIGAEQVIDLRTFRSGTYTSYTCASRYRQQCIDDGSFDNYYDEKCEYETVSTTTSSPSLAASPYCGDSMCNGVESCSTCSSDCGACIVITPTCTPNCAGKQCGDNGCGGSCGTCLTSQSCIDGRCVQKCVSTCFSSDENKIRCLSNTQFQKCVPSGSCWVWSFPIQNCQAGYECKDNMDGSYGLCVPACISKSCAELGIQCGDVRDNCGISLSCLCPTGLSCVNGKCTTQIPTIQSGGCGTSTIIVNSCTWGALQDILDNATDYLWNCGSNGCNLPREKCGSTKDSCIKGNFVEIPDNATDYLWKCTIQNGGSVSCNSQIPLQVLTIPINGVCGSTKDSCINGTLLDIPDNATDYLWNCIGQNGGVTRTCNLQISSNNQICSTYIDGSCPATCSAGSDADCCKNSGKFWLKTSLGYGCYSSNYNPGCYGNEACGSQTDGCCPNWCAAGSDADCCINLGKNWVKNSLGYYNCVDNITQQTTTTQQISSVQVAPKLNTAKTENNAVQTEKTKEESSAGLAGIHFGDVEIRGPSIEKTYRGSPGTYNSWGGFKGWWDSWDFNLINRYATGETANQIRDAYWNANDPATRNEVAITAQDFHVDVFYPCTGGINYGKPCKDSAGDKGTCTKFGCERVLVGPAR